MQRGLFLVLLLGAGATTCGGDTPTRPERFDVGREFTLAPGQTGAARGLSLEVRFIEVTEDSRCPTDVQCVWAGEVKVRLSLKGRPPERTERELREGESTAFEGHELEVVRVEPAPVSTRKIAAGDYRATLRATAAAAAAAP